MKAPIIDTIYKISGKNSNIKEHLISKKTPAVTIVAAWINAETGVGPSMASGNQVWRPIWADLDKTPINKNKPIKNNKLNFILKIKMYSFCIKGIIALSIEKSSDPYNKNIIEKEAKRETSPTLLTINALKADLTAWILENQKFIKK